MKNEVVAKAEVIVAKKASGGNDGHCVVTTIDENGYPVPSTVYVAKADGIRRFIFGAVLDSDRVKRIKKCNRTCVCVNSDEYHMAFVGTMEVLADPQSKLDAWNVRFEEYFSGSDDPNFCALRFTTERYSLYLSDEDEDTGIFPKE